MIFSTIILQGNKQKKIYNLEFYVNCGMTSNQRASDVRLGHVICSQQKMGKLDYFLD